ncbi:hypothetical protein [uncultured Desulfosarcina sp.]|uniref:hypothetical protein n=1 Tax=uncultured Desulfosarcina sp. TaxID=218289 RepID=UPI0029C8664F|nr:hypothetical protein [uncultured Desulfosarcina sp.]
MKQEKYFFLLLLFILLGIVLTTSQCEAFYKFHAKTGINTGSLSDTEKLNHNNEISLNLSIYNNANVPLSNQTSNLYIVTKSKILVSLIDLNIHTIQPLFRAEPLESGQFVENLIYANLRIQILIKQYRQLHEKARMFKTILSSTILDGDNVSFLNNRQLQSQLNQYRFRQLASKLNVEAANLIRSPRPINIRDTIKNEDTVIDAITLASGKQLPQKNILKPQSELSPSVQGNKYETKMGNGKINTGVNSNEYKEDNSNRPKTISDLPWFIRFFLVSYEYLMNNKIEGLLYFSMFFIIICVLSGTKR